MREGTIIKIGGELLKMEKVSYKVFRRINPKLNSKWLCLFDGKNYYRFPKETNLKKLLEQAKLFLTQELEYSASNFNREFGFIPVYVFNNLLFFDNKEIPEILKVFRNSLKIYIEGDKIPILPDWTIEYKKKNFRGKRQNVIVGKGRDFLFFWLTEIFQDKVRVLECESPLCQRVFIPAKKGEGQTAQRFCSESCRDRAFQIRRDRKSVV